MESLQEFFLISFAVFWLLLENQESRVKQILPVSDLKVWEPVCFCDNHTRHKWVNLVKDKKKEIWVNTLKHVVGVKWTRFKEVSNYVTE